MRKDYGMEAEGIIFGFPQDIRGAIIQFPQGEYYARYFITNEELAIAWRMDGVYRINQDNVKLIAMVKKKELTLDPNHVTHIGFVSINRCKVPLWTSFKNTAPA
jgi:hypothetical protein